MAGPLGAVGFALAGALVGVIATVAWLGGQAAPRVAAVVAVGILTVAMAGVVLPIPFAPWGWAAGAYPVDGTSGTSLALGALAALAVGLTSAVPAMMSRLSLAVLVGQAMRWDAARDHAAILDVGAASGTVLYGVSDERLLAFHLLFPVVAVVVVMLAAALVGAGRDSALRTRGCGRRTRVSGSRFARRGQRRAPRGACLPVAGPFVRHRPCRHARFTAAAHAMQVRVLFNEGFMQHDLK